MDPDAKRELETPGDSLSPNSQTPSVKARQRVERSNSAAEGAKRRCVSTACIACRRRKSKCDGNTPACAACSSVYGTPCVYDPGSDHRRKGVYKKDIKSLKTRDSTLQVIVQAILNYGEEDVPDLIRKVRTCDSLDKLAEVIDAREHELKEPELELVKSNYDTAATTPTLESTLANKMGHLQMDAGSRRYIGATSNLLYLEHNEESEEDNEQSLEHSDPITSWTEVTNDPQVVMHILNMYFTWHYSFFTTLSKYLFFRDFMKGLPRHRTRSKEEYCTPLLVNAMLALGCHFTSHTGARADPEDSSTAGDHFFKETRRLIIADNSYATPSLATVQALALMSVREAGCGRESEGWVYSGISFRMALDLGLNYHSKPQSNPLGEDEEDARKVTFWGCFLFDKCWSNYLGRLPMFMKATNVTVPKFDVFPDEEAINWSPYTDSGFMTTHAQPSRTRAVALQISSLCDISTAIMKTFYLPEQSGSSLGKQAELKHLGDLQKKLEKWRADLPNEMAPKEGGLSSILVMHMFAQLLYIHLFRPFLKYNQSTSPLPANVSPRKLCTQAATTISKLLRLYKRSYGLRQICNVAVYIAHSACTIHLLNLPDKNAKRDITHGIKHLEQIAEGWPVARRTLMVLSVQAQKWKISLPEEAAAVLARTACQFGKLSPTMKDDVVQHVPAMPTTSTQTSSWTDQQQESESNRSSNTDNKETQTPQPIKYHSMPSEEQDMPSGPSLGIANASSGLNFLADQQFSPHSLPQYSNHFGFDTTATPAWQPSQSHYSQQLRQHIMQANHQQSLSHLQHHNTALPTSTQQHHPTDIFDNNNSLLNSFAKEGHDWWMRDQSQVASGFGNWNMYDTATTTAADGSCWQQMPSTSTQQQQPHLMPGGSSMSTTEFSPIGTPGSSGHLFAAGDGNGGNGAGLGHGMNMMHGFEKFASYDEDEWYR